MSLLSQGAKLADSPELGFTFDFLIYSLMQMHTGSLLNFSRTAQVCLAQWARLTGANMVLTLKISWGSGEYGTDHDPWQCSAGWENGWRKGMEKVKGRHPYIGYKGSPGGEGCRLALGDKLHVHRWRGGGEVFREQFVQNVGV